MSIADLTLTYEESSAHHTTALAKVRDKVNRALLAGFEYTILAEEVTITGDGEYTVSISLRIDDAPPGTQFNLAIHTYFPEAAVERLQPTV